MKFLFLVTDFDVGGITASLRNLTALLCERGHKVDILNLPNADSLPSDFDKRIELIPLDRRSRLWNLSGENVKRARGLGKIKLLLLGFIKKLMNRGEGWMNYAFRHLSFEGYDAVIGFRQSPVCFYLVSRKTRGGKKCGFWHVDIEYAGDISSWDYLLSELDSVACVSNAVNDGMRTHYPQLSAKMHTVYNLFDDEKIKKLASESCPYDKDFFNIVTVSRLSFYDKQVHRIPEICARLKESGVNIRWHIVGGGKDKERLEAIISRLGVEDMVMLYGAMDNPFPYIKNADLFVLTSLTESYGMTLVESLILGTPVVAGAYPALTEIIENGINGLIAENSTEGLFSSVLFVLSDKALYEKIKLGAEKYEYTPEIAYNQFMEMVK